jgi:RNA polymerase sigma-70 factor (ECF subfamily)
MDLQAFKTKVLPTKDRLFRLAKLFLRNREEAEDTMQEVMLRLWTNRQNLDTYHSVEALAVRMTRNLCLDKLKSQKRKPMVDVSVLEANADCTTPYQKTELSDSLGLVRRLFNELPEQQKLILHLRDVEDYSFEKIEEVTGLSTNNIRVILSRARKNVRENYLKVNDYEGH